MPGPRISPDRAPQIVSRLQDGSYWVRYEARGIKVADSDARECCAARVPRTLLLCRAAGRLCTRAALAAGGRATRACKPAQACCSRCWRLHCRCPAVVRCLLPAALDLRRRSPAVLPPLQTNPPTTLQTPSLPAAVENIETRFIEVFDSSYV